MTNRATDPASGDADRAMRQQRERSGRRSEAVACLVLRLSGYRILARRWVSPRGEIDIIASRGRRLVFIEVKRRPSTRDGDAHAAISPRQRERIHRAGELWLARHPDYRAYEIGFDLMLIAPWRWPRHIRDGL